MKRVLITGASRGIGAAIAIELASPSCSLFLHYHQGIEGVEDVARQCEEKGADVQFVQADLTSKDGDKQLLSQLRNSPIDMMVHNAGTSHFGLFTSVSDDELTRIMNIHLLNPIKITRALLPHMIKEKAGKIIIVSSIWGLTGAACEVIYSAAKGGINSFVKGLAKEVAPSGIQVNGVAPGVIETNMLTDIDEESITELKNDIPANSIGSPQDVAHTVSFLCSSKANYINGQIISINGAWYC